MAAFELIPLAISVIFRDVLYDLYSADFFAYMIVNVVLSQLIIFGVAIIWCKIRRANPFSGGGYVAKFDFVQILMSIILVMGVMMTFYFVHLELAKDSEVLLGEYGYSDINYSKFSGFYALVYVGLIILMPAIIEEMLFRGIIMRGLEEFGSVAAVIISAVMFSFMHGSFSQMLLQFIGGLAIGAVVIITKNWLLGSIMHAFNNFYSSIFQLLITYDLVSSDWGFSVKTVTNMACIIIGIVCLIVSVLYFGKLALKNKIAKEKGEKIRIPPYEKREFYLLADSNGLSYKPDIERAELKSKREYDERRFFINGEFRKLNAKAPKVLSIAAICVGLLAAIVLIFI